MAQISGLSGVAVSTLIQGRLISVTIAFLEVDVKATAISLQNAILTPLFYCDILPGFSQLKGLGALLGSLFATMCNE